MQRSFSEFSGRLSMDLPEIPPGLRRRMAHDLSGIYAGAYEAKFFNDFLWRLYEKGLKNKKDFYLVIESQLASFQEFALIDESVPAPPFVVLWKRPSPCSKRVNPDHPDVIRLIELPTRYLINLQYPYFVSNRRIYYGIYHLRQDFHFIEKRDEDLLYLLMDRLLCKHPPDRYDYVSFIGAPWDLKTRTLKRILANDEAGSWKTAPSRRQICTIL